MWMKALLMCLVAGAMAGTLDKISPPRERLRAPYILDPALYLFTAPEFQDEEEMGGGLRGKRGGPSLSIVEPIDVLRNRVMIQMQRQRQRQNEHQALANRMLLKTVGKRQSQRSSRPFENEADTGYFKPLSDSEWDSSS